MLKTAHCGGGSGREGGRGGAESRSRPAESGSDRQTAEQLGACAKVRVGGFTLIKLIPPPRNDVIQCLLIRDSCADANTNSQPVVSANMSSYLLSVKGHILKRSAVWKRGREASSVGGGADA